MLTSLTIENFRAFKRLEMPDLGRVNLIEGENGSGKTCVLEAVELLVRAGLRPSRSDSRFPDRTGDLFLRIKRKSDEMHRIIEFGVVAYP